jgi:lipopolysaccharide transport system ATP-binding protein
MADIALSIENLSKAFKIRHEGGVRSRYKTLREDLIGIPKRLWSRFARNGQSTTETFWALKDVSFEVKQGEVVGIIGRNGAGKSTLLKILSRITEPTSGQAKVYGRVGSLLEVGTGFHPELTGRENIFLNGAILGMSRAEIRNKFDEIVAFAEVEKFLDTPVKRYSSGMYVRLAFAVAAHLDPEILVIDEVLAVGDAGFQKKCLGKMGEVARAGRTILVVSHQMALIANLCSRCILLSEGRIARSGPAGNVIPEYFLTMQAVASTSLGQRRDRKGSGQIRFLSARAVGDENGTGSYWVCGKPGRLVVEFENRAGKELRDVRFSVGFDDSTGQRILLLDSELVGNLQQSIPTERGCFEIMLDEVPLMPGSYHFTLFAAVGGEEADWIQSAGTVPVEPGDFFKTGRLVPPGQGSFLVRHRFVVSKTETTLLQ